MFELSINTGDLLSSGDSNAPRGLAQPLSRNLILLYGPQVMSIDGPSHRLTSFGAVSYLL
jgi:hypothetical protein